MQITNFYNLYEGDSYRLFELCKQEGWTDCEDYEEWYQDGGELAIFEGDPDMIKLDGETGYFFRYGSEVFYYFDDCYSKQVEGILRDFFAPGEVRTFGYYTKYIHEMIMPDECQNWDSWERMKNGIAYRGGAGYIYNIIPLRAAA